MFSIRTLLEDALHLFYPHTCQGCGSDLIEKENLLCIQCLKELPHTNFALFENNFIENIFRGRMPVKAAHSEFYFSKGKLVQQLIHELKYRSNKEIGYYLGNLVGRTLKQSGRFNDIDYLIALPLFPDKEKIRGYNQAEIICDGIAEVTEIPVLKNKVTRKRATETQTKKHRAERWQNVVDSFQVAEPEILYGKNILLADDVITTGASIEACGQAILQIPGTTLNVAALAHASK